VEGSFESDIDGVSSDVVNVLDSSFKRFLAPMRIGTRNDKLIN